MFLSPEALGHLDSTSSRRRTERQAMEEALQLLAERDAQQDAMKRFIDWARTEWGSPTKDDFARADELLTES